MNDLQKFLRVQWDRSIATVAVIIGVIALFLGYRGVSGTEYVAAQLPYFVSGGLIGIFFLGIAGIAWISADLRDEWRELRALRELLEAEAATALVSHSELDDGDAPSVRTRSTNGRRKQSITG
jgi:hydrogenase/urease accessory protein HupE